MPTNEQFGAHIAKCLFAAFFAVRRGVGDHIWDRLVGVVGFSAYSLEGVAMKPNIECLRDLIALSLPEMKSNVEMEHPASHWLTITYGAGDAEVEWRDGHGFGVNVNSKPLPFTGHDEVYDTAKEAAGRIVALLKSNGSTKLPE